MSIQNTSCGTHHPIENPQTFGGNLTKFLKQHWENFVAHLQFRRQRRIDRQAFQHMLTLEDRILKDIGINRDDVKWANRLPLDRNASQELEKIASQNRTVI